MKRAPRWVPKSALLAIHEALLAAHGGREGLIDEGRLDAAPARPQHLVAYEDPDVFRLAAAYAHGLTKDHPFVDGNKRLALTVAGVFLELNGFRLEATEPDAVTAMLALSTGELDEEGFAAWLRISSKRTSRARGR